MCPQKVLLLSGFLVLLQIHTSSAQLRNPTLYKQGIDDLDYFDPVLYSPNTTRIVGGRAVNIKQVPWQVALLTFGEFICGGSVISADWVLTAAHCISDGDSYTVRAGSANRIKGGQYRSITLVAVNIKYNSNTMNQDIALLRVNTPFQINEFVRPVALAKYSRSLPYRYFVSGWGHLKEGGNTIQKFLRGVTVRKVSRSTCMQRYIPLHNVITKDMICTASPGKDACQADSGGPMVLGGIQYGIVSFGGGCARENYPGVYTDIRALNKWIGLVVKEYGGIKPNFV